jgi:hypothetical protein
VDFENPTNISYPGLFTRWFQFPGILKERTFRVVFVGERHGSGGGEAEQAGAIVKYDRKSGEIEGGKFANNHP